eukprot:759517-Hanusia_phi.AAC.7
MQIQIVNIQLKRTFSVPLISQDFPFSWYYCHSVSLSLPLPSTSSPTSCCLPSFIPPSLILLPTPLVRPTIHVYRNPKYSTKFKCICHDPLHLGRQFPQGGELASKQEKRRCVGQPAHHARTIRGGARRERFK